MVKLKLAGLATGAAFLILPVSAMAATVTNATWDGQIMTYGTPLSTKNVTLRIVVATGERVRFVETLTTPNGGAPKCHSVGGNTGLLEGTHNVSLPVLFSPITGTESLDIDVVSRMDTGIIVDCEDFTGGVSHFPSSFGGVIRVIPSSSPSVEVPVTGTDSVIASLQEMIKDLMKQIADLKNPPAPVKPTYCASMIQYNGSNAWAAQSWLLTTPFASGFHAAGVYAPTGFWGTISTNANLSAMAACK